MRLVDEQQVIVGKKAKQRVRRAARRTARQRPAVVLDPRAVAHLLEHFQVEPRAGAEPLGLQQLPFALELFEPRIELLADLVDGPGDPLVGQHEVLGRIDEHLRQPLDHLAAGGIDRRELLDLVAPEFDAVGKLLVAGPDFDAVAPHAELARLEFHVVPLVLDIDQAAEGLVAVGLAAPPQADHHRAIILGRAQAVNAGDAGHDDHVAATDQGAGRRQPQAVDLLVDRGVFFDVDVALRDVRLGLIVIVVADEIMDRVLGKEFLEFAVKLGGQRLVVRHDQRGPLHLLDHVGHGEGLARAGHPHQHLLFAVFGQAADQGLHGLGLVACQRKWTCELKHQLPARVLWPGSGCK